MIASLTLAFVLASGQEGTERLTVEGPELRLDGKPLRVLGYGDRGWIYRPQEEKDYAAFLDLVAKNGINLLRTWVCAVPEDWVVDGVAPEQPIVRTQDGKYHFDQLNPKFWKLFDKFARLAAARDIVLEVTLWDASTMNDKGKNKEGERMFKVHPVNKNHGGFLYNKDTQTAFPDFWQAIYPEVEKFNTLVLQRIKPYWNVVCEPVNEPGAHGATIDQVKKWHKWFYNLRDQVNPKLLVGPNLVIPNGNWASVYPDPWDAGVDFVSFHGATGLRETARETRDEIVRIRDTYLVKDGKKFRKFMIFDDDGLHDGAAPFEGRKLYRWMDRLAHGWAVGALWAGAAYNHLEDGAPSLSRDDPATLDALRSAREVASMPEEWKCGLSNLPFGLGRFFGKKRSEFPVGDFPDLAIDEKGTPHLAFLLGRDLRYGRFDGTWRTQKIATVNNPAREHNLPQVATVGDRAYVVWGDPAARENETNRLYFLSRTSDGGWSVPTTIGGNHRFETFDAVGFGGKLEMVVSDLAGGGSRLYQYSVAADNTVSSALLLDVPEAGPDLAAGPESIRFAVRFRNVRIGEYVPKGSVSSQVVATNPGSPSSPQVAIGSDGTWAVAWVQWRWNAAKTLYRPYEVWLMNAQGGRTKIADVTDKFTSAEIDLAFDYAGRPAVVYDVSGQVRFARIEKSGAVTTRMLAYGVNPKISTHNLSVYAVFSGPRSGAVVARCLW